MKLAIAIIAAIAAAMWWSESKLRRELDDKFWSRYE